MLKKLLFVAIAVVALSNLAPTASAQDYSLAEVDSFSSEVAATEASFDALEVDEAALDAAPLHRWSPHGHHHKFRHLSPEKKLAKLNARIARLEKSQDPHAATKIAHLKDIRSRILAKENKSEDSTKPAPADATPAADASATPATDAPAADAAAPAAPAAEAQAPEAPKAESNEFQVDDAQVDDAQVDDAEVDDANKASWANKKSLFKSKPTYEKLAIINKRISKLEQSSDPQASQKLERLKRFQSKLQAKMVTERKSAEAEFDGYEYNDAQVDDAEVDEASADKVAAWTAKKNAFKSKPTAEKLDLINKRISKLQKLQSTDPKAAHKLQRLQLFQKKLQTKLASEQQSAGEAEFDEFATEDDESTAQVDGLFSFIGSIFKKKDPPPPPRWGWGGRYGYGGYRGPYHGGFYRGGPGRPPFWRH